MYGTLRMWAASICVFMFSALLFAGFLMAPEEPAGKLPILGLAMFFLAFGVGIVFIGGHGRLQDVHAYLRCGVVYACEYKKRDRSRLILLLREVDSGFRRAFDLSPSNFTTTDFPDHFVLHKTKDGKYRVSAVDLPAADPRESPEGAGITVTT